MRREQTRHIPEVLVGIYEAQEILETDRRGFATYTQSFGGIHFDGQVRIRGTAQRIHSVALR